MLERVARSCPVHHTLEGGASISVQLETTGYDNALIFGNAEEITEDSATAFLLRGEVRAIDVYLYNPNAQGKDTSWTLTQQTPEPEEGTGTLRLLMERQERLPLHGALASYLRDGTLLRYIRQRAG